MPFLSQNLAQVFKVYKELDEQVELTDLVKRVAESFGNKSTIARALLEKASGKILFGTLQVHLLQVLKVDSAVRDLLTTGHLAKFLARKDIFLKTMDYRIVGMPNRVFDEISQIERVKYFERGASLEFDADIYESAETQAMLKRELEIINNFLPTT